jgi:hypothetical protein
MLTDQRIAVPGAAGARGGETGRGHEEGKQYTYLERVRGYHQTEAYQKAMRKRKVWPEPLFGEAKQWHGLRQFRLRGLAKVNTESLLVAAVQNLKRWLTATGWGRRHAPGGALALPRGATNRRLTDRPPPCPRLQRRRRARPPACPARPSATGWLLAF